MSSGQTTAPRRPASARSPRRSPLSAAARRCLGQFLALELKGEPAELHTWYARNAKKIALIDELRRFHAVEGNSHCEITFFGLMNAPGKAAALALSRCEKVFVALRKYYPKHSKESLPLDELARRTKLSREQALQSARFLSRSPAFLGVGQSDPITITPNLHYVQFDGIEEVKSRAQDEALRSAHAKLSPLSLGTFVEGQQFTQTLETSECEQVRECWGKAKERIVSDPTGAVTAGRALLEAACKYVLEEFGETEDSTDDLPQLFKKASSRLQLDPRADVHGALKRTLGACATLVDGIAELRNKLGDAHGKGRHSARPAKRHAELVVMIAGGMAGFLLATLDAQRTP